MERGAAPLKDGEEALTNRPTGGSVMVLVTFFLVFFKTGGVLDLGKELDLAEDGVRGSRVKPKSSTVPSVDLDLLCLVNTLLDVSDPDIARGLTSSSGLSTSGVSEAKADVLAMSISEEHFSLSKEYGTFKKVSGMSV